MCKKNYEAPNPSEDFYEITQIGFALKFDSEALGENFHYLTKS